MIAEWKGFNTTEVLYDCIKVFRWATEMGNSYSYRGSGFSCRVVRMTAINKTVGDSDSVTTRSLLLCIYFWYRKQRLCLFYLCIWLCKTDYKQSGINGCSFVWMLKFSFKSWILLTVFVHFDLFYSISTVKCVLENRELFLFVLQQVYMCMCLDFHGSPT